MTRSRRQYRRLRGPKVIVTAMVLLIISVLSACSQNSQAPTVTSLGAEPAIVTAINDRDAAAAITARDAATTSDARAAAVGGWGRLLGGGGLGGRLAAVYWGDGVGMGRGGAGLASIMFAMILGHWYLNVTELPIHYLGRGIGLAFGALGVHLIWVLAVLSTTTVILGFRVKPAYRLLFTMDGFFLWVGLILGLIAPLVINGLAWRTARLGATQSATGLLYVSLILVVMGLLIFDSFILQLGLPV